MQDQKFIDPVFNVLYVTDTDNHTVSLYRWELDVQPDFSQSTKQEINVSFGYLQLFILGKKV